MKITEKINVVIIYDNEKFSGMCDIYSYTNNPNLFKIDENCFQTLNSYKKSEINHIFGQIQNHDLTKQTFGIELENIKKIYGNNFSIKIIDSKNLSGLEFVQFTNFKLNLLKPGKHEITQNLQKKKKDCKIVIFYDNIKNETRIANLFFVYHIDGEFQKFEFFGKFYLTSIFNYINSSTFVRYLNKSINKAGDYFYTYLGDSELLEEIVLEKFKNYKKSIMEELQSIKQITLFYEEPEANNEICKENEVYLYGYDDKLIFKHLGIINKNEIENEYNFYGFEANNKQIENNKYLENVFECSKIKLSYFGNFEDLDSLMKETFIKELKSKCNINPEDRLVFYVDNIPGVIKENENTVQIFDYDVKNKRFGFCGLNTIENIEKIAEENKDQYKYVGHCSNLTLSIYNKFIAHLNSIETELKEDQNIPSVFVNYPKIGGIYNHYKGGIYKVLFLSKHTETYEILVNYQSEMFGSYHSRPLDKWNEKLQNNANRFELQK